MTSKENAEQELKQFKRKRTTARANITRFTNLVDDSANIDDLECYRERLQESFDSLCFLDYSIQTLLDDEQYETDIQSCEEYIDISKRTIHKLTSLINKKRNDSTPSTASSESVTPVQSMMSVKLPTIKLETFSGNIEAWSRFWEQFQSSIDENPSVSNINKHVFLRGYLEGEPKRLVDAIAVTGDTYEQTKKILESRYGDKNRIIQAHLDFLEDLKPTQTNSPDELNNTYVECHRRIEALKALGENIDAYGRVLTPKLLRAFPDDICRRWLIHAKRERIPEGNITQLMEFLNEEVTGALNAQKIRGDFSTTSYLSTTASFKVATRINKTRDKRRYPSQPFCVFCGTKGHWGQNCEQVTTVQERIERLKTDKRCFLCLNKNHTVRECTKRGKVSCIKCKNTHHVSICRENTSASKQPSTSVGKIEVKMPNFSHLQTARIWIIGPTGSSKLARCILDPGSQSCFVKEHLVDSLQMDVTSSQNLVVKAFESSNFSNTRRLAQFDVMGFTTKTRILLTAFESNHTYSTHPAVPQDINVLACTRKLRLADPRDASEELPIELLIGADHYWKTVKMDPPIRITTSLVLLPTLFGWILSGTISGTTVNQIMVKHISCEDVEMSDDSMRHFWELEAIGITEPQERQLSAKDTIILQQFHESYRIEDNRRVVSLPRKEVVFLSDNRTTAEKRFHTLEKRMEKDANFKSMYHHHMTHYIRKDQVELAPSDELPNNVFYLPHHAVKKQQKGVTKWRIVFDASSHERGSPSLNDALEMGPNLLPEILATLLRFRMHKKAIVCDGHQAFLQLKLDERDRNLTKFFWYRVDQDDDGNYQTTNEVTTYRFVDLPFGLTSRPFLLSATLRELASLHQERYPTAAELIDECTFMDDFTASVENDNKVITLYYELTALLKRITLPLAKWATNSQTLKSIWKAEGQQVKSETCVLGVDWNTDTDDLSSTHEDMMRNLQHAPATKRQILQITSKIYDPLGLISPVLIIAKILFQDTWCRGLDWNEILPPDLAHRWRIWTSDIMIYLLYAFQGG